MFLFSRNSSTNNFKTTSTWRVLASQNTFRAACQRALETRRGLVETSLGSLLRVAALRGATLPRCAVPRCRATLYCVAALCRVAPLRCAALYYAALWHQRRSAALRQAVTTLKKRNDRCAATRRDIIRSAPRGTEQHKPLWFARFPGELQTVLAWPTLQSAHSAHV